MSKNTNFEIWVGCLVLVFVFIIASGCGNSSPATTVTAISVSPASAAIGSGQTTRFTATGDPAGVTWAVAGGGAAGAGTIDANGNFTAPTGASTTVTVTA